MIRSKNLLHVSAEPAATTSPYLCWPPTHAITGNKETLAEKSLEKYPVAPVPCTDEQVASE